MLRASLFLTLSCSPALKEAAPTETLAIRDSNPFFGLSMKKTKYVTMVVIDPTINTMVALTKKSGPAHLIGRITFPGGKLEEGEGPFEAATREMLEETNVHVPRHRWHPIRVVETDTYELTVLAANSPNVAQARQMEQEPVWKLQADWSILQSLSQPDAYAHDFATLACQAMEKLKVPVPDLIPRV